MAHIISVVNQKGGVGKTTTTVNLAAYLAHLGKFVLVVDMDPQANASSAYGIPYQDVPAGTYEALIGSHRAKDLIRPTAHEGLKILPATPSLAGASIELVNELARERRLHEALLEVRNDFDYIFIDNAPSLGILTVNGLVAADSVLIPVQAEYFALEGLGQLLNTVELVRGSLKPDLKIMGAVITMFDPRTTLAKEVFAELYRYFPDTIFRSVIPRSIRLAEAPSHGKSILSYDPESKAAKSFERLAKEFLYREEL